MADEDLAYQAELLKKEEWPHYKHGKQDEAGIDIVIHEPFLIMEVYRLIPYIENKIVCFHPLNMPHIKVGKIEIVGVITASLHTGNQHEYVVEDGTGVLSIVYMRNNQRLDTQNQSQSNGKEQDFTSTSTYEVCMDNASQEQLVRDPSGSWRKKQESLEKEYKVSDYVYARGYLMLDFYSNNFTRSEFTAEDLSLATPKLLVTSLTRLSEKDYNTKLQWWIHSAVAERYSSPLSSDVERLSTSVAPQLHKEFELSSELLE